MAKQKFSFQSSLYSGSEPSSPIRAANSGEPGSPTIPTPVQEFLTEPKKQKSLLDAYKIIPRKKIRFNKRNDYPITEMEELEDFILHWGLLQDILVIYSVEEDLYIVEAGHRRVTALDNLIKKYQSWDGDPEDQLYKLYLENIKEYEKGYVCKVIAKLEENIDYDVSDDEMTDAVIESEIRLIITNEGARSNIPASVKARNINRLVQLYEKKNIKLKGSDKINVNETIAKQMNMSERQVIYYKNTGNLIPELQQLFEEKRFSLKVASSYSSLEPEAQLEIANSYQAGNAIDAKTVSALKQEQTKSKEQIDALEKELAKLKKTPATSAVHDYKLILSLLFKNVEHAIQELNRNISSMDSQPPLDEWIESQKDDLKKLL